MMNALLLESGLGLRSRFEHQEFTVEFEHQGLSIKDRNTLE
jgi:hypothetical protein